MDVIIKKVTTSQAIWIEFRKLPPRHYPGNYVIENLIKRCNSKIGVYVKSKFPKSLSLIGNLKQILDANIS